MWVADEAAPGAGYALRTEPQAYIGPGRPLGFRYDSAGNLVVCDSLKVGERRQGHSLLLTLQRQQGPACYCY